MLSSERRWRRYIICPLNYSMFFFSPLLSFFFSFLLILLPSIIIRHMQPEYFAHLLYRKSCAVSADCLIFHSGGCMKMCRDFFRISTFNFSSSAAFFWRYSSRSLSLSCLYSCFILALNSSSSFGILSLIPFSIA